MSNPYIKKEVSKILSDNKYPNNMALASAWVVAHFKGFNIKIYDTQKASSLCDYNLIASADNIIQAKSMIDEIIANVKEEEIVSLEGMGDGEWILLDMGDVIIHIFQDLSRGHYDLDSLWSKETQLEIPQSYYFGQTEEPKKPEDPSENYF